MKLKRYEPEVYNKSSVSEYDKLTIVVEPQMDEHEYGEYISIKDISWFMRILLGIRAQR